MISSDAAGDVDDRGDGVFDVGQELLLCMASFGGEEGAIGVMRMPVDARRLHIRAPRCEALAPVVRFRGHAELRAKRLVGPVIEGVQIPRMRFFSGKGDSQLLKNTPSGDVNMEAIQTRKDLSLEMVLNRDATSSGGATNREVYNWHCHQSKGVLFQEFQALSAIAISPASLEFWYWAKMSGKEA